MPTFSNQAQLSYNGITANSNIAYGQILEVLAASKTALSDTYTSGDRITYIFSIVNSGTGTGFWLPERRKDRSAQNI